MVAEKDIDAHSIVVALGDALTLVECANRAASRSDERTRKAIASARSAVALAIVSSSANLFKVKEKV